MAQANINIDQQTQEEQDYHEVEFLESFEVDEETALHDKWKNCKKDPEHSGFIPVEKFTIEHLPEGHRDQLCYNFIMALIHLTVRLVPSYVSNDRPVKYKLKRGKCFKAFGSGLLCRVDRKIEDIDGKSCPCLQCENLADKDRKKQWGMFQVVTAKHVVYNKAESRFTQVDVDYNTDTDRDTCPKLHGVDVWGSNKKEDQCLMYVVSHDRDVCLMLEKRIKDYDNVRDELVIKYSNCNKANNPAIVCVSHPHGESKHVSVGEFIGKEQKYPYKWRYTTSTCVGSSGAPVCGLGEVESYPGYITHHRGFSQGYSKSGTYGWYW